MATNEEKIARLKELMRIAKVNDKANNQEEFCKFIGKGKAQTLSNTIHGKGGSLDNYIEAAERALEDIGIKVTKQPSAEDRLNDLEHKVKSIERTLSRLFPNEDLSL